MTTIIVTSRVVIIVLCAICAGITSTVSFAQPLAAASPDDCRYEESKGDECYILGKAKVVRAKWGGRSFWIAGQFRLWGDWRKLPANFVFGPGDSSVRTEVLTMHVGTRAVDGYFSDINAGFVFELEDRSSRDAYEAPVITVDGRPFPCKGCEQIGLGSRSFRVTQTLDIDHLQLRTLLRAEKVVVEFGKLRIELDGDAIEALHQLDKLTLNLKTRFPRCY